MRKIIVLLGFIFLLISCGKSEIPIESKVEKVIKNKNKITVDVVEKNLDRLKNVDIEGGDLEFVNRQLNDLYFSKILNEALDKKDFNICEKLDSKVNECKESVFVNSADLKSCDNFGESNILVNNCKNKININFAVEKIDKRFCDKIITTYDDKREIINCNNRVITEKAKKEKNKELCSGIKDNMGKQICEMEVDINI